MKEELGVETQIEKLLEVKAKLGSQSRLHWVMIFYQISLFGTISPDPDEIDEAQYSPLSRAKELIFDSLMREVIVSLL